jgi:hypothetical protein
LSVFKVAGLNAEYPTMKQISAPDPARGIPRDFGTNDECGVD